MSAPALTREKTILAAGWALLVLVLAAFIFGRARFPLDDAYITLHNARVLLSGGVDTSYAGATALTGATSAVHLVAVAAAGLVFPLETASRLVALASALLYAAAIDRIAVRAGCSRLVLVFIAFATGYQAIQLTNGLETAMAAAAIAWALVLRDSRWLPLLCGAMPFVRPELALLAAPLMARQFWRDRSHPLELARGAALAVAGAAPWLLLYLVMTGSPLPLTAKAKILFFAEAHRPVLWKLDVVWLALTTSCLLPLTVGFVGLVRLPAGWCATLFLGVWLSLAFLQFPGGLAHNYSRYLTDAVPILLYGAAPLMARRGYRYLGIGLTAWAVLSFSLISHPWRIAPSGDLEALIEALKERVPAHARVAIHDAGYIAWRLPGLRLTDVVGLKSPLSLAVFERLHPPADDRGAALDEIMRRSRSDYFVVLTSDPYWRSLATALASRGWRLKPVNDGQGYTIFQLTPPSA